MRRGASNRRRSWFLEQLLSAKEKFRRQRGGYVLMLVSLLIPVILAAVSYTVKLVQKSHNSLIKTSASAAVAQAIMRVYNPGKTWTNQKTKVYSAGAQALNDRAYHLQKSMTMAAPTTVVVGSSQKTAANFNLVKMYLALSSYGLTQKSGSNTYFHTYAATNIPVTEDSSYKTLLCDNDPLDNVSLSNSTLSFYINTVMSSGTKYKEVYYKEDTSILETSLDATNNFIKCDCKKLGKIANAYPARCDVDIVLTIPTNHAACTSNNSNSGTLVAPNGTSSAPIREIAESY
ncbi:MAG: hypothetical protein LBP41_04110, partial [Holosporaceae bacterium]|nr:hypothetical protein [Holosporaceae bacterium]